MLRYKVVLLHLTHKIKGRINVIRPKVLMIVIQHLE